jgi:predicted aminopeptidase
MKLQHKLAISIILIVATIIIYYQNLIGYGLAQGYGQINIWWNTQANEVFLADKNVADSLKNKLMLISEIKKFASDSLGLSPNENYTTIYNQNGKPILWTLTAAMPFELKAYEWEFPIVGKVGYKGFFDHSKAIEAEKEMKALGYETSVDEVSAWSTLGWFKDPVLSNMLYRSEGSLSNLIIHELTHGTIFIKNKLNFNENIANFVGDKGAEKFLIAKYGIQSSYYEKYQLKKKFNTEYNLLIRKQSMELEKMYQSISKKTLAEKLKLKEAKFDEFSNQICDLYKKHKRYNKNIDTYFKKINNTFYLDENRYNENQMSFEKEFVQRFNSDLKLFVKYWKDKSLEK